VRRIEALNNPLVWIVGGALIASWLFGAFHTYRYHQGLLAVAALLFPPYGLYMAAEQSFDHARSLQKSFNLPVSEVIERNAALCEQSKDWQQELGLNDQQFTGFCTCAWTYIVANFPADENDYVDKHARNSPEFDQVKMRATETCRASSLSWSAP